ncbi:MAG: PAS domain-containing protein [Burkholderiaceae bacterium]|nr:PAS domain-containing protein [Burkholderiaceae bacterium]
MRINLPVSGREKILGQDDSIVTRTDLKGRITYVNEGFLRITGYPRSELIGKPHNVIRHPDMPPEAFADMWRTLENGSPWSGVIKNRCANGDHYWVRANVTPVREHGEITGYLSVRTRASTESVARCEPLYRRMRAGTAHGLTVIDGRIVRKGNAAFFNKLGKTAASTRIAIYFATLLGCIGALLASHWLSAELATLAAGALAAITVLVIGLGWIWMRNAWIVPMERARNATLRAASGELDAHFGESRDPTVDSMLVASKQMTVSLRGIIGDSTLSIESLRRNVATLTRAGAELAARTGTQRSSLVEIAATLTQLCSAFENTASGARRASELASIASRQAQGGGAAVDEVIAEMQSITDVSRRIGTITSTIESIAFQTNILALNAAVEAARAGDQGRGFAVVAGEVRSLATRATEAAAEISALVTEARQRASTGSATARRAGETMHQVVASFNEVDGFVSQIAIATNQQAAGVAHVSQATHEPDAMTERNASMAEQTADVAQGVQAATDALAQAMGTAGRASTDAPAQSAGTVAGASRESPARSIAKPARAAARARVAKRAPGSSQPGSVPRDSVRSRNSRPTIHSMLSPITASRIAEFALIATSQAAIATMPRRPTASPRAAARRAQASTSIATASIPTTPAWAPIQRKSLCGMFDSLIPCGARARHWLVQPPRPQPSSGRSTTIAAV